MLRNKVGVFCRSVKLNRRGRQRKRVEQAENKLKAAAGDAQLEAIIIVAKRTQVRIDAARQANNYQGARRAFHGAFKLLGSNHSATISIVLVDCSSYLCSELACEIVTI